MEVSRQIYLGKTEDGKEIRKRVYARTKKELEEECVRVRAEWKEQNSTLFTLSRYCEKWYKETKETASLNTKLMYENLLKHIANSPQGGKRINEVKLSDLQQLINAHNDSPNICKKLKMCLNSVFEYALMNEDVKSNPTRSIVLPKQEQTPRYVFTNQQISALSNLPLDEQDKAYAFTLFFFGLRPGEALALERKDFDFQRKELTIDKAVAFERDGNTPYVKTTKTDRTRTLPITKTAESVLKNYVEEHDKYIFTMEDGGLVTKSSNTKRWRRIIKTWNTALPSGEKLNEKTKPYCFRYTYATKLYYSGISLKKASELMGHANTKMLLEIYAQLDNSKERLDALENCFNVF